MADIELVIKIPQFIYEQIMKRHVGKMTIAHIFKNGKPLPKGHGRLIDADDVTDYEGHYIITDAPTIIEADVPKRREGTPLEENDSGYNCENWIP